MDGTKNLDPEERGNPFGLSDVAILAIVDSYKFFGVSSCGYDATIYHLVGYHSRFGVFFDYGDILLESKDANSIWEFCSLFRSLRKQRNHICSIEEVNLH